MLIEHSSVLCYILTDSEKRNVTQIPHSGVRQGMDLLWFHFIPALNNVIKKIEIHRVMCYNFEKRKDFQNYKVPQISKNYLDTLDS